MEKVTVEYIDEDTLDVKTLNMYPYIPHEGENIWIDDNKYEVTSVIPYFYKNNCKEDKIRVYIKFIQGSEEYED